MSLIDIQRYAFNLLNTSARRKYLWAFFFQASLTIFEIAGIALAGLIGLFLSDAAEGEFNIQIRNSFSYLGIEDLSSKHILTLLSFCTLVFFIFKSALSLIFTRRIFSFLSKEQTSFSEKLTSSVMESNFSWIRIQDPHQVSASVVLGASALITNGLGHFLLIAAEIAFLFIFILVLFIFNPLISLLIGGYFLVIMLVLRRILGRRVELLNTDLNNIQIENQSLLFDNLRLVREIRILSRGNFFSKRFSELNASRSKRFADDMWIQQVPKYFLEMAMLLGVSILIFGGARFTTDNSLLTVLALYFTAASRLVPSLLRIQASIFSLQSKKNYAELAIKLSEQSHSKIFTHSLKNSERSLEYQNFESGRFIDTFVQLENVTFRFDDSINDTLSHLNLKINRGERIALIGPSGSGKSTLCDILLGLLNPTEGKIQILGQDVSTWISNNPGKISYLPQDVTIISGTILENVCLGIDTERIDLDLVQKALQKSALFEFVESLPEGVKTSIGPNGIRLSGGQKQRLGLSRALYSEPEVLILDESTSALDIASESEVIKAIEELDEFTTVVTITHRLSSIMNMSRIVYLQDGKVVGDGDMQLLRRKIPDLQEQLNMLGI